MKPTSIAGVVLGFWFLGCGSSSAETGGSRGGEPSSGGTSKSGAGAASGETGTQLGGAGSASPSSSGTGGWAAGASNGAAASGGTSGVGTSGAGAALGGLSNADGNGGTGGEAITTPAGYKLVWHDEFDVDGAPDPKNWKFEKGFVRNEEDQWYQAANASVQGGLLVLEARLETVQNPNYTGTGDWKTTRKTAEYTSSSINTSGLQSFQYGHFEMRARIPTDAGMWPAWWTLGESGEWPSNGEIDIMEYYQGKVLANVACGTATRYQAKWDSATQQLSALGGAAFTSQFHVWTMDWDDQNIILSLDGTQMNTTALSAALNADGTSPFKQKDYLLLNLALGGQNGGDPSKTTFPQRYEVDYVRVFQKQ
ncbi:MAG: glycoside hydrolase family 16 protein [Polyangiaceae bacterium]